MWDKWKAGESGMLNTCVPSVLNETIGESGTQVMTHWCRARLQGIWEADQSKKIKISNERQGNCQGLVEGGSDLTVPAKPVSRVQVCNGWPDSNPDPYPANPYTPTWQVLLTHGNPYMWVAAPHYWGAGWWLLVVQCPLHVERLSCLEPRTSHECHLARSYYVMDWLGLNYNMEMNGHMMLHVLVMLYDDIGWMMR